MADIQSTIDRLTNDGVKFPAHFTFSVRCPPSRITLIAMCEQYDPGRTVIRSHSSRRRDGTLVYMIDVYEPTPYGKYFWEWLCRGEHYETERKKNPDFPECLHGPVWYDKSSEFRVWPRLARSLPHHS